jgi:hypothetical protein
MAHERTTKLMSVIELTNDQIGHFLPQSFSPLSKVDYLDDGKDKATYLVAGFPAKLCHGRDRTSGKLSPEREMIVTQVRLLSPLPRIGLSAETHLFLRFKKSQVCIDGRKSTAPDPTA